MRELENYPDYEMEILNSKCPSSDKGHCWHTTNASVYGGSEMMGSTGRNTCCHCSHSYDYKREIDTKDRVEMVHGPYAPRG